MLTIPWLAYLVLMNISRRKKLHLKVRVIPFFYETLRMVEIRLKTFYYPPIYIPDSPDSPDHICSHFSIPNFFFNLHEVWHSYSLSDFLGGDFSAIWFYHPLLLTRGGNCTILERGLLWNLVCMLPDTLKLNLFCSFPETCPHPLGEGVFFPSSNTDWLCWS